MAVAAPPRRQSHIAPGMVGQPSRCEAQPVTNEGQRDHLRIGILTPLAAGGYFGGVIGGIVASAEARGARLIVIQTLDLGYGGAGAAAEGAVPRFAVPAAWDQVAGFIVVLNAVEPWYLRALQEAGKPVVLVSSEVEGFRCPVVRPDNRSGIIEAVSHLVEHGHRRIAFAGSLVQSDIRERLAAYREALLMHGIEPDPGLIFEAENNAAGGGELVAQQMLAAGLPSTAVVAATDYNALDIMRVLSEAGLALPEGQAITGFDDVEEAASARPTLSTVCQRFEEMGRLAADLLLGMVSGGEVADGGHRVPSVFLPRESCGCRVLALLDQPGEPAMVLDAAPRDRLRSRLARALVGMEPLTAPQTAALDRAVELVAGFAEAETDSGSPRGEAFREVARALWAVSARWTTATAAVACLRQYQAELAETAGPRRDAAELDSGIVEMVVEFGGSLAKRESNSRYALQTAMAQDHDLSMSLVRGAAQDLTSLGWIAHTPARAGCIGMWSTGGKTCATEERLLTIAGSYLRDGGRLGLPDQVRCEEFPPTTLLEDLKWGPGELAIVLPARTASSDFGLLALVTSIDLINSSIRDRFFETGALLSLSVEREEMTEKLRRSNADLATFSHAMAHDLRNPLATISMWASVARARAGPGDVAEAMLRIVDQIGEVSTYAGELVSDLLRYAELDGGAGPSKPVNLNLAVERALANLESTIVEHGAVVETGDLPTVLGNFAELELVLQNLVENAIKHGGARAPRIRIDAQPQDGAWTVRCRDNGGGIPADLREQIFEPFVRGETGTPGSGLGLATCRRIVEGLGGRIWVDEIEATGTTFALTIPARSEKGPDTALTPTWVVPRASPRGIAASPPPTAA
jgi:signal transduction histidine kinase/DNA-binding LacI/PurR family transcriptional regulator